MRVPPRCGCSLSRRINGRTDITWSAAAAARIGLMQGSNMLLPPDGVPGPDSVGLEFLAFFISVGETLTKNIGISLAIAAAMWAGPAVW